MASATAELPDNATAEQRDAFIESYLDSTTEPTDTTQTETLVSEKPSADADSVDQRETQAPREKVDEVQTTTEADDRSWFNAERKSLAKTLGFSDEELQEIQSEADFDKVLNVFERREFNRRKTQEPAKTDQVQKQDAPKPEEKPVQADGKYKVTLSNKDAHPVTGEVYDEGVVQELNSLNDHYSARMAQLEQRFAQYEQVQQATAFDKIVARFEPIVDSLNLPDVFGKTRQETADQMTSRNRFLIAVGQVAAMRGVPVERALDNQALVDRALHLEFGPDLLRTEHKRIVNGIKNQSSQRLGRHSTRTGTSDLDKNDGDFSEAVLEDAELTKLAKAAGFVPR